MSQSHVLNRERIHQLLYKAFTNLITLVHNVRDAKKREMLLWDIWSIGVVMGRLGADVPPDQQDKQVLLAIIDDLYKLREKTRISTVKQIASDTIVLIGSAMEWLGLKK